MLTGLLWPRNPLIQTAPDVFDVGAWPFELTFARAGDGPADGFTVAGPAVSWGRPDAAFDRVR